MKHIIYIFFLSLIINLNVLAQDSKTKNQGNQDIPEAVLNAFTAKLPGATLGAWKTESNCYIATFTLEGQKGRAEFTKDGDWKYTKYTISEKELPGPIISDFQTNYKLYKIKVSEMIQEPETQDYYYLYIKKEAPEHPSAELYYSITGKLIKKVLKEDKKINEDVEKNNTENTKKEKSEIKTTNKDKYDVATVSDDSKEEKSETKINKQEKSDETTLSDDIEIKNTVETISTKELPTPVVTYIKKNFAGYSIKEAVLSTTDKGTFYFVKIKSERKKNITELTFDIKGKFLEKKIP